jgi:hypothetical protein
MTIAYLPSEGSVNKVGITPDNLWFGESIGGKIVDKIKKNSFKSTNSYFNYEDANLTSSSRWFFKDVTEFNFLNGATLYRCLYIGADEKYKESEIIGSIQASISHNGPSEATNSVDVKISYEGKYTVYTSTNSKVLASEQDSTGLMSNVTNWSNEIVNTENLNPGEYLKIWIRLDFSQNADLTNITNYDYFITVKDITIPMQRSNGRMPMSRIFSMSLTDKDCILGEVLPREFRISNVYKIIENQNRINIFHIKDERLKMLIIKPAPNPEESKYLEMDISSFIPGITADNHFISNITECFTTGTTGTSGTPETTGSSGTPGTTGTSGTSGSPDFDNVLDMKFLVDILGSNKTDRNDFYIFYNTFLSDTTQEFIQRYGYKNYYWNCGLVHININHINDSYFESILPGIENKQNILIHDQFTEIISTRFFINSIVMEDDLITGTGYIPEDCRTINNKTKMFYLWEGDIINRKPLMQFYNIPAALSTVVNTIQNKTSTESYLIFEDTHVNLVNFGFKRTTGNLTDNIKYVNIGSPTQTAFHHGLSPVSYDIPNTEADQFSTTWSFGISDQSILNIPISGNMIPDTILEEFDQYNPCHWHIIEQQKFDSVVNGAKVNTPWYKNNIIDKYTGMFNIHCLGNQDLSVMKAHYNFNRRHWVIYVADGNGEPFEVIVNGVYLYPSENTITINMYRQLDYGCAKKYIVYLDIWVNGRQLFNGVSYIKYTNDSFAVTHNNNRDFAGWLSYWDIRNYIETGIDKFAKQMFQIHSNISWGELESENENITEVEDLKMFNFKRNILLRNLEWGSKESIVIPIVIQGSGYGIDKKYNKEVRRSVFDFSKIDLNQISFAFTYEGSSVLLDWESEAYSIDRDMLVIWVRLDNWSGQRLTMFYSDVRLISNTSTPSPYTSDWISVWHMNENIKVPRLRFINQKIYVGGEHFVKVIDSNNVEYLVRIDKQFVFGSTDVYKSNKFDMTWNDVSVNKNNTQIINDFIKTNISKIKPAFMEIRDINPSLSYKMESGDNTSTTRPSNIS